jgi:hypothetical protein
VLAYASMLIAVGTARAHRFPLWRGAMTAVLALILPVAAVAGAIVLAFELLMWISA